MSHLPDRFYSFVIPVYNRPDELRELLQSVSRQTARVPFEVVVVEDGSEEDCSSVVASFSAALSIRYLTKENTGPGNSRNYGMSKASGEYFLILDSDCVLPEDYLEQVHLELGTDYVDCFGGPDRGHADFSPLQKAVNFSMTSGLTTGGIRGAKKSVAKFQPRSFNMGLSREAFEKSGGFGPLHPGEDPDLVLRLWQQGIKTRLFPNAWVYHKRRLDLGSFLKQVHRFGQARPILNHWHPESRRGVFWLPALFLLGWIPALMEPVILGTNFVLAAYIVYLFLIALSSAWASRSPLTGGLTAITTLIQFVGYGWGFLKSWFLINFMKLDPEAAAPELFRFKKAPH